MTQQLQLLAEDWEYRLVIEGEARRKRTKQPRRFCPSCGSPAQLIADRVRHSRWRCQRCRKEHLTCEWPGCGARLPELELPLACPMCMSILNMDAARRGPQAG